MGHLRKRYYGYRSRHKVMPSSVVGSCRSTRTEALSRREQTESTISAKPRRSLFWPLGSRRSERRHVRGLPARGRGATRLRALPHTVSCPASPRARISRHRRSHASDTRNPAVYKSNRRMRSRGGCFERDRPAHILFAHYSFRQRFSERGSFRLASCQILCRRLGTGGSQSLQG